MVLSHTTGAHVSGGTLIVFVDSPVWATELTSMSEQYRVSLNEELGQELVKDVRFSVSRKVSDEQRLVKHETDLDEFYREDDVEPIPLSDNELAQVKASAERIPDESLREAAIRATVKDLEWKKGVSARNSREKPREGS